MDKHYSIDTIKAAANEIYGKRISPSAWRKWLRLFGVRQYGRLLTPKEALFLMVYARLRRDTPNKALGVIDVKKAIMAANINQDHLIEQVDQQLLDVAKGKDLPLIIRQHTGKKVALRTLYRWANKHKLEFSTQKPISRLEIQQWVNIAS